MQVFVPPHKEQVEEADSALSWQEVPILRALSVFVILTIGEDHCLAAMCAARVCHLPWQMLQCLTRMCPAAGDVEILVEIFAGPASSQPARFHTRMPHDKLSLSLCCCRLATVPVLQQEREAVRACSQPL